MFIRCQQFNTLAIAAVPVQRNYQTNIYGSLLTSTANFKVEIKPAFTDTINIGDWDGKTVVEPVINEVEKTVTVRNPAEFMGLLSMTNGDDSNNFEGYTVTLTDDLDFKGNPAVLGATSSSKPFSGVLDGQGHTLKNVTINPESSTTVALIGTLTGENAEVKNLNFENLVINAPKSSAAGIIGTVSGGAKITDVVVKSGKIETRGGSGVAAIISYVSGPATITGCVNEGADVVATSSGRAAGVIGYTTTPKVGESIIVSDCHNKANVTAASSSGQYVGGVVGMSSAEVSNCTNTGTITGGYGSLGGVVGEQRNCGNVTDCVNTGAVKDSETGNYGVGGVIGWVRFYYSSNYKVMTVENCKNTADIYAPKSTGVGGIVGMWYNMGTLTKCENTANSITGSLFVAGLSGGQQLNNVKPSDVEDMLYVKDNRSTTKLENIKGGCNALYIYVNNPQNVTIENNVNE